MSNFFLLSKNLPKKLDDDEQIKLFEEYAKNHSAQIKDKLLEHNLRLCSNFAITYCTNNDLMEMVDDVYSESVIYLSKAIDYYDVNKGFAFSTFANRAFYNHMKSWHNKMQRDALANRFDTNLFTTEYEEKEYEEDGLFSLLRDSNESTIAEDYADSQIIAELLAFIDDIDDETTKTIVKMYTGIGFEKKMSKLSISKELNMSIYNVDTIIKHFQNDCRKFLIKNHPDSYGYMSKDLAKNKRKTFASLDERNQYIVDAYLGNNTEQKNLIEISAEVGLSHRTLYATIKKFIDKYNTSDQSNVRLKGKRKYPIEVSRQIFDKYYGLNGEEILPMDKILSQLKINSENIARHYLSDYKLELIEQGVYTAEQLEQMTKERRVILRNARLKQYEYEYNSYYGLNGYEKKTPAQLGAEANCSFNTIYMHIEVYKKHLNAVKSRGEEKEQENIE